MLDGIAPDQSSGPAQPCLAVDGQGFGLLLCEGEELLDDGFGGTGAVGEVEFVVVDACGEEGRFVVGLVVESDDGSNSKFFEDGDVVFGGEVGGLDRGKGTPCSSLLGS